MIKNKINVNQLKWLSVFSLAVFITSCGSKDTVLGPAGNPVAPPIVLTTSPTNDVLVVPVHNSVISAKFNQPIVFDSTASFKITCVAPCTNPTGAVEMDETKRILSFSPTANLAAYTLYTATVSGAKGADTHLAMQSDYVWHFTTGVAPLALSVAAESPVTNSTGVATNIAAVTAYFSEPIGPLWAASSSLPTGAARFALTCETPCVNPTGSVSLDANKMVANYWLASGTTLAPLTRYTATISDTTSLATGAPLAAPVAWQFTTGNTPDVTRPSVTGTSPAATLPGPTLNVPTNMAISASFSEALAPASISAASFSLACTAPCVSPAGTVSYATSTQTAVFTPSAALASDTTYTATVSTAAVDLAGNALANNYVWSFTTGAAAASGNVTVASSKPASNALDVCPNATINASFSLPSGLKMDPLTINSSTFKVAQEGATPATIVASSIVLDHATGTIASFKPQAALVDGTRYTATLKGGASGVKDFALPANSMASDYVWSFTAEACPTAPPILISLGSAATFGAFGGSAGTTSQGIYTMINGDLGTTAVSTAVTGFHDGGAGCTYTETTLNTGAVNGSIFTAAPSPSVTCLTEGTAQTAAIAAAARADALIAYNALVAQAAGADPGAGNLANLVLARGVYTAASGSFMIQDGNLTLDAQGDTNAMWVFQMASSLTVGGPGASAPQSITLVNGAQAKNVFWQVGTAATINAGGGGIMAGTIISQAGAAFSTPGNVATVTLNGRVLSLNASVTLVNTVINVPAQ